MQRRLIGVLLLIKRTNTCDAGMCVCVYGVAKIAAQLCSLLVGTNSEMLLSNSIRSNGCACVRRELYHIGLTYWLRHAIVIHV